MVKIIKNLNTYKIKDLFSIIDKFNCRLNELKEDVQTTPDMYDITALTNILSRLFKEFGDCEIVIEVD